MKEILFGDIRPFVRSAKKYTTSLELYSTNANYNHFLVYSLGSETDIVVNDVAYTMESGDILIIRPGDRYRFIPRSASGRFIFVDFDYTQANCNSSFGNLYEACDKFKKDKIFEIVKFLDVSLFNFTVYARGMYSLENKLLEIVREYLNYDTHFVMKSSALMISILCDIAKVYSESHKLNNEKLESEDITEKILKYINCNFHKDIDNRIIGKEFALHPNYINLLIKRRTGYTLHKYILARRNSHAVELLEQTTDPVYVISEKCGFKDPTTFTRSFKEFVGITPQQYREKKNFGSLQYKTHIENSAANPVSKMERYKSSLSIGSIDAKMIENAYNKAMQIIELNMIKFVDGIPFMCSDIDGRYSISRKDDMGCGYWAGIYILAYDMTGDRRYRFAASKYIDNICQRLDRYDYKHFSEMGLLYVPSCVSAYNIGKIEKARIAVIRAADILSAIYKTKDGIYFTNNNYLNIDADKSEPIKISAMCNCSVLYWAHEFTGVGYYKKVADDVTDFIIRNLISDDGTVYWDYDLAETKTNLTAILGKYCRAISWGLYGLAVRYRWNKDNFTYDKAVKILDRYMPEIMSADISSLDSTMLSCIICAVYDIAKETKDQSFKKYIRLADELLARLITDASLNPLKKTDGLIGYSYGFSFNPNFPNLSSVIGDYFYLEALTRKKKDFDQSTRSE